VVDFDAVRVGGHADADSEVTNFDSFTAAMTFLLDIFTIDRAPGGETWVLLVSVLVDDSEEDALDGLDQLEVSYVALSDHVSFKIDVSSGIPWPEVNVLPSAKLDTISSHAVFLVVQLDVSLSILKIRPVPLLLEDDLFAHREGSVPTLFNIVDLGLMEKGWLVSERDINLDSGRVKVDGIIEDPCAQLLGAGAVLIVLTIDVSVSLVLVGVDVKFDAVVFSDNGVDSQVGSGALAISNFHLPFEAFILEDNFPELG